jgi:hypothetical protein
MFEYGFEPASATVAVGDTVRWTNNGAFSHSSTSGRPDSAAGQLWDSPFLGNGQSFDLVVTFTGTDIPYYCRLHSLTMKGRLTAAAGVGDRQSPAPERLRLVLRSLNPDVLSLDLPSRLRVSLRVYDAAGKEVTVLLGNELLEPGRHSVSIGRLGLPDGVYLVSLAAGRETRTARMTLIR